MPINILSSNSIIYVFIYFIEAFILNWYCHKIFYSRYDKKTEIIFLSCCYLILLVINRLFQNIWINYFWFAVINFIFIYIMFKLKWYAAIFHVLLITISMSAGELITLRITEQNLPISINFESHSLVIYSLISKTIYFIIIFIAANINKQKIDKDKRFDKIYLFIIIISFISAIIIYILLDLLINTNNGSKHNFMIYICTILILVLNLIILCVYSYTQKKNNEFTELQIQLQKEYDSTEYYKMLLSQNENQNILIHDIKKHLQSINLLNEQNEREKIAEYIDRIIKSSDLSDSVRVCDNDVLNAIISRYSKECRKNNIAFHTDIRKNTIEFMQENDITSLFCNLLDNALESALKQRDSFIEINIEKKENTDYTVITMVNTCRINPFSPKTGKLVSSKKDRLRHGYGMKSIERIANSYGGDMQTYFKEGENIFYTIVTLKNMSDDFY